MFDIKIKLIKTLACFVGKELLYIMINVKVNLFKRMGFIRVKLWLRS